MSGLIVFDLTFLGVCIIALVLAIVLKRNKFKRQGWIYLYPTQLGVKLIDKTAKKFPKTLHFMKYVVVAVGYALLVGGVWMILASVYLYIRKPGVAESISAPPIFPVIPYFTSLFSLDSFFPPFYFIYFLVAIAIVAVVHEFAHGIFARLYKMKIHSTGFAFLGPFLGAYVEPDEKQMDKSPKIAQLSIQAAGVFANTVTAILCGVILLIFFTLSFAPAGINLINGYPTAIAPLDEVLPFVNSSAMDGNDLIPITIAGTTYFAHPVFLNASLSNNFNYTQIYLDTPSLRSRLVGDVDPRNAYGITVALKEVNGEKITSRDKLTEVLSKYKPGDQVEVKIIRGDSRILSTLRPLYTGEEEVHKLTLGNYNNTAILGIRTVPDTASGGRLASALSYLFFSPLKNLSTYYESNIGEVGIFLYYLIWWVAILSIFVALFNMLPLGPLDGGKFLLLTVWSITRNKKAGERAFQIASWIILIALILMMVKWVFRFA